MKRYPSSPSFFSDEKAPRAVSIIVKGFKSIKRETEIDFKPVTILAGRNSAGKSAVMQPLLLVKQTTESASDPGPLLLNGDSVRFTDSRQLFWHSPGGSMTNSFELGFRDVDGTKVVQSYKRHNDGTLEVESVEISSGTFVHRYVSDVPFDRSLLPPAVKQRWSPFLDSLMNPKKRMGSNLGLVLADPRVVPEPSGVGLVFGVQLETTGWAALPVSPPMQPLADLAREMIYLPGLRGNPERDYKTRAVGRTFPGPFQDYVASIIGLWKQEETGAKLSRLGQDLTALQLGHRIDVVPVNDVASQVLIDRRGALPTGPSSSAMVNIADVGLGVSQVLPILVALIQAEQTKQLVYVEQPETHLHPMAQRQMASVIVHAASQGVRVVVETHSSLFLLGLQTAVAQNLISPEDLALYWFDQDAHGATRVIRARLDDMGQFSDWPADFDDVAMGADEDYLRAVNKKTYGRD